MKIKIVLDKKLLNDKDIDFFHYGCSYKLAECEYGDFYITSRGELKCTYIGKDAETQNYNDIIKYYVKDNNDYLEAINDKLILDLNNWLEIEFYTKAENNNNSEYVCLTDDIFGSISECLSAFKEIIKNRETMQQFEKELLKLENNN